MEAGTQICDKTNHTQQKVDEMAGGTDTEQGLREKDGLPGATPIQITGPQSR